MSTDQAALHAAVQTALWDTAEREGARFTPGALERLANAAINAIGHNGAELEQRLEAERQRAHRALAPLLSQHPLTQRDVHGDNLSAGYLAESARDLIRHQAAELEQWRSGARITQESSDQQDRAVKAEHRLADTLHELEAARTKIQEIRDRAFAVKLNEHEAYERHRLALIEALGQHATTPSQSLISHIVEDVTRLRQEYDRYRADARASTTETDALVARLTAAAQLNYNRDDAEDCNACDALDAVCAFHLGMRHARALLSPFEPGDRVRVGECVGTVERQPRRVRVRLDGAAPAPATFDARFVHPVTDEEQAAGRLVEVDPPPAGVDARVLAALKAAARRNRPAYAYEARDWMHDGARVECFSGKNPADVIHTGRCVGFTEAPTVRVQKDDGQVISWVLGLTRPAPEETSRG